MRDLPHWTETLDVETRTEENYRSYLRKRYAASTGDATHSAAAYDAAPSTAACSAPPSMVAPEIETEVLTNLERRWYHAHQTRRPQTTDPTAHHQHPGQHHVHPTALPRCATPENAVTTALNRSSPRRNDHQTGDNAEIERL